LSTIGPKPPLTIAAGLAITDLRGGFGPIVDKTAAHPQPIVTIL
jgi:hypothetical protein